MNTPEYLKAYRQAVGIESDYATAKHLEVSRQAVSRWQSGLDTPGPLTCFEYPHNLYLHSIAH